jgi:hypothetical protein
MAALIAVILFLAIRWLFALKRIKK